MSELAAVLQRSKPEISQLSEHVSLANRSLINCIIMLNNQNNDQAALNWRDAEQRFKEVKEMLDDLSRKIRGENA